MHPVAVKYFFGGDIRQAADDVLTDIEHRLTWQPQRQLPLMDRIIKVGSAALEPQRDRVFRSAANGTFADRLQRLIDRLLGPPETEWFGKVQTGPRCRGFATLRARLLPEMVAGTLSSEERARSGSNWPIFIWRSSSPTYPPGYLCGRASIGSWKSSRNTRKT